MKPDYKDWAELRLPFTIFMVIFLLSVSTIIGSWIFKGNMLRAYQQQKQKFAAISRQYLAIDDKEAMINEYYPEFLALYENGVLGQEHRLNWIETLRVSNERIKLPGLTYSIAAQQKYSPDFNIDLGDFVLYSSTMDLHVNMLHEGDLLRLIDALNKDARGIFTINKCDITQLNDPIIKQRDAVNVKADCELQWLSIGRADGSEIKPS